MIIDLYWLKDGKPVYQRTGLSFEEAHHLALQRERHTEKEWEELEIILFTSPKGKEMPVDNIKTLKGLSTRALNKMMDNILLKKYKGINYE